MMTHLEELGLNNCLMRGHDIERLAVAMQEAPFLGLLRKLNFSSNELDTEESVRELANLVAKAPRCDEILTERSKYI